ncbi:MAG: sulfurtransferase TusA family protein [Deltaproteobacteria bacterium]|nr:sulfurtransferase TusA family protein [Deltaproteobacteria bacterium]MBW2071088.1 sulfurtransferase TusA family protein [Deltaproteobacteria bacterium]
MRREQRADRRLDLRGWSCAWCILKAKSELDVMQPGQILEVLITDQKTMVDLPNVLGQSGHQVVEVEEESGFSRLYVRKGRTIEHNDTLGCQGCVPKNRTRRREQ